MTAAEFVELAKALKDLGALEVQAGEYRCAFAVASLRRPPTTPQEDDEPSRHALAAAKRARERGGR